ncbi:SDR family NAD(P)-dependent oxidoreductase [Gordonia rubripertincta]|uniref:SDR family NAD(P)-dependent oxidoreductase n=1 Tax=Gordonia rubripertincta TaxID=36822 RepID=A0ABT4N0I7_GORRU|nr:SDR family NAD(P)-dependent oxidoreductase [Gordonia rubripertincta]MCZ4551467.1 SDR family NAD(P)-dependent oxidoreductase [Gordonia rubripertincta]
MQSNSELASPKVALVTGAGRSRGIGAATALHLASAGYAVALTDVIPDGHAGEETMGALKATAEKIGENGGRALIQPLDVTDNVQVTEAIDNTVTTFGGLSVLVNNAGTGVGVGPFATLDDSKWDLSWQINVMGAVRLSRVALPHLAEQGGSIVNVASTAGIAAEAGYGAYVVTKHALVGLTRLLAAELGPSGVRVNAVAPGMIHTDLGAAELDVIADSSGSTVEEATRAVVDGIPLGRLGTPDDVAAAITWLAEAADYVSGAILPVHGAAVSGLN